MRRREGAKPERSVKLLRNPTGKLVAKKVGLRRARRPKGLVGYR